MVIVNVRGKRIACETPSQVWHAMADGLGWVTGTDLAPVEP